MCKFNQQDHVSGSGPAVPSKYVYWAWHTPDSRGAERLSLDLVQLLVSRGADHLIKDSSGRTALDWARSERRPEVAMFLGALPAPPVPRHDFVDTPGLHFRTMSMEEFQKKLRRKDLEASHI